MSAVARKVKNPGVGTGGMRAGGRPPFKPTDEQRMTVKSMAAIGMTTRQMGFIIGVDKDTLRKHFDYEIKTSLIKANLQVASNLFTMSKDNVRAAEFWLINRDPNNWKLRQVLEQHITVQENRPDLSRLTPTQIAQVRAVAQMLRGATPKTIEHQPEEDDGE